jgi:hypothetical protein
MKIALQEGSFGTFLLSADNGQDVLVWADDPSAPINISMFVEALGVTSGELTKKLFCGISQSLLRLANKQEPFTCPLCKVRR